MVRGPEHVPHRQTLAGAVFLLAASIIIVGQWLLYDVTPVSQTNRVRSLLAAAVLVIAGVRMLLTPRQDHAVGVRWSMLAAGVLLCFAVLAPHESQSAVLAEGLCGCAALLAAIAALPPLGPRR